MEAKRYDDCRELFAALSGYLDAELPADDCEAIQAHIAACAPCVEFVNSLKKTIAICRTPEDTPAPAMSAEVKGRLLAAYRESIRKSTGVMRRQ
jgi:anti-sigma factor RsiW